MKLIDKGETLSRTPVKSVKVPEIPKDFLSALKKNLPAHDYFKQLSPSHKKEYLAWIIEAKREETRIRRISQAVEMLSEQKGKNWKYETKSKIR
jgi:uncharacterized protein YdeI (YjbR/CyaY-like superfamily)